jgi:hypothetical protein
MSRQHYTAKIIYYALIAAILFYIGFFAYTEFRIGRINPIMDKASLEMITLILAVFGIIDLVFGYYLPRIFNNVRKRSDKQHLNPIDVYKLSLIILQGALFEAIGIYGLVLGMMGVNWGTILIFFAVGIGALILTFPTEQRWNKLAE